MLNYDKCSKFDIDTQLILQISKCGKYFI